MKERHFTEAKVAIIKVAKETTRFFKVPRTNVPDLDTDSIYKDYIEDVAKWSASWGTNDLGLAFLRGLPTPDLRFPHVPPEPNKPRGPARGVGLGP